MQPLREADTVARLVKNNPAAPAVEHEDTLWSYGELESRANRLAWFLRALGIGPEGRVALFVERRAETIAAMLGVLKAGGAYVPLDPAYPRERLAFMLADSGARVVLAQESLLARLPETAARVVCLDRDGEEIARFPQTRPQAVASGQSTAYMIYTSGSTGRPKGVLMPHEAVAAYSQVCSAVYGSAPGDRNLQFASISFDASVEEIYSSLTRGATLVVRGEVQEGAAEFVERLRRQRITLLQLPTAYWHQLVTVMDAEELRLPEAVRVLFVGGEKMLAQRLVSWWRLVRPGFRLINAYGPTETTVAAVLCDMPTVVAVRDDLHEVPIGRPLSYARSYVLDRTLHYPAFALRMGRAVADAVRAGRVDIVHAQGLTALGYGRARRRDPALRAPLLMNPQGMEEHKAGPLKRLALSRLRALSREAARLSDRVIATDEATRDEVPALLGIDPARVAALNAETAARLALDIGRRTVVQDAVLERPSKVRGREGARIQVRFPCLRRS